MNELPKKSDIPDNVHLLIEGYCANSLSDEEFRQLESHLTDNELYQTYFLGYLAVHSGLHWSMRNYSPELPSRALPALTPLEVADRATTEQNPTKKPRRQLTLAVPVLPSARSL